MPYRPRQLRPLAASLLIAALAVATPAAHAEAVKDLPPDRYEPITDRYKQDTEGVGIDQNLGKQVPMDLRFTDTSGREVRLGDYFNKGKPVILQLGYFRCPMICDIVSHGVMDVAKQMDLEIGKDYDMLFVSINPEETWDLAQQKKRNYVEEFRATTDKGDPVTGWNFLVGAKSHSQALAEACGFHFKQVAGRQEFSHPTAVLVLTPDGKISRYLFGNRYGAPAVRLALVEASDKKIGDISDQLLLLCYHYDGFSGKYTPRWMFLMRVTALFTVLTVGLVLGRRWWIDSRSHPADNATT